MTKREYKQALKERYDVWVKEKIGIRKLTKEEIEQLKKEGRI